MALRLIAPQPERFPGRALRLALAAEGFLLGKFAIYHKPMRPNMRVLSAASLTRPGAFDLESMDSQRYGGPQPLCRAAGPEDAAPGVRGAARDRPQPQRAAGGALQDERGGPLTPLRVASIRDSLDAEAASPPAAAAQ